MTGPSREPQSYGSGKDWTRGTTDQQVNDPKAAPPLEQSEFYDARRESETTGRSQGGLNSPVLLAEQNVVEGAATEATSPVTSVSMRDGGAKRESYFRKRDYE